MPFGLLLPLGFAQGPGQAYSMGTQWEALGFTSGGTIGLAISTFGFLWAAFGGLILLNALIFRKKAGPFKLEKPEVRRSVETTVKDYEFSDIDGMTIQMLTIGLVYFVTYMFLKWFTGFIGDFGTFGETFSQVLWGFHFVIGVMFAFIFRKFYDKYRNKKEKIEYVNNFLLQRAAGVVFDFMVAASIAAISFELISEYIVPIILLTTIGGFGTMIYSIWFCKRIYKNAVLEHIIAFFGMHTGTISTGMALLREVDPQFDSGTAEDMVMGSGLALFLGLPLMLIINIPIMGFRLNQPIYYLYTILALIAYFAVMYIFWFRKGRVDKE
jgi:ESS family glutamate:Na+ symporter